MMKKMAYLLSTLSVGLMATSCNDDDNFELTNAEVKNTFSAKYPEVSVVDWELKSTYYVAEFRKNGYEMEAWFTPDGNWIYTETDLSVAQLPDAVRSSLASGDYSIWKIDDIDKIERLEGMALYVIEVENGKEELDLYFSEEGELLKVSTGALDDDYVPFTLSASILSHIETNYPEAKVLDSELENGLIEVLIKDGDTYREAEYAQDGSWIQTTTEVRAADVPETVMTAFSTSEYSIYVIDDIEFVETSSIDFYWFELEQNDNDFYLKIAVDGTIITE